MTDPNPVRTLPSIGVVDQLAEDFPICQEMDCEMQSIKVNSKEIRYVERCRVCGWIDGMSLSWWAEDAIKQSGSKLAQRISVATQSDPFRFVQGSREDLTLDEILGQALGAASVCWSKEDLMSSGTFNSIRAQQIWTALRAEIMRFQLIEGGKALSAARRKVQDLYDADVIDARSLAAVMEAIR